MKSDQRFIDQVAADARLLSLKTTTFGCEEGSLTGESVAVFKSTDPVAADSTIAVSLGSYRLFSFVDHFFLSFFPVLSSVCIKTLELEHLP